MQINIGGIPASWNKEEPSVIRAVQKTFTIPYFNALEKEDLQDEKNGITPRFGFLNKTNIDLTEPEFKVAENKSLANWKAEIYCPSALSINFVFDKFWLPDGVNCLSTAVTGSI